MIENHNESTTKFLKKLKDVTDEFRQLLILYLPKDDSVLSQAMRYVVLSDGKRLRPFLCYICANSLQLLDKKSKVAVDLVSVAIELIHSYSLAHDDLPAIDNDNYRRNIVTCHIKFGEDIALLAGDALQALAFEILTKLQNYIPALNVINLIERLAVAVGVDGMVGGQAIDVIRKEHRANNCEIYEIENYGLNKGRCSNLELEKQYKKTASLFGYTCESCVIIMRDIMNNISDDKTMIQNSLYNYGFSLGMLFQIADDIRDNDLNMNSNYLPYRKKQDNHQTNQSDKSDKNDKSDLKNIYPLDIAKYYYANAISILYDLQKRNVIDDISNLSEILTFIAKPISLPLD